MTEHIEKNIKFMGNQIKRNDAIVFVDAVLKEKGHLDNNIDLSKGLFDIANAYMIHIIDDDDSFAIKLEPLDEEMIVIEFIIDKESRTLYRSIDNKEQQTKDDENIDFLDEI